MTLPLKKYNAITGKDSDQTRIQQMKDVRHLHRENPLDQLIFDMRCQPASSSKEYIVTVEDRCHSSRLKQMVL